MTPTEMVQAEVAVAALLDVECLRAALVDDEVLADVALWGGGGHDGATEVLATHPTVHDLMATAVCSPRPQVRATVAARPDLDVELYAVLASDDHPTVRGRVAANPSAPGAVVRRLLGDESAAVRSSATAELDRRSRAHP